jgi:hypothetical protein
VSTIAQSRCFVCRRFRTVLARKISYKHGVGVRYKTKKRNCQHGHVLASCMGGSLCLSGLLEGLACLFGWFTAVIQHNKINN